MNNSHHQFVFNGKEYETDQLSEAGKSSLTSLQFSTERIKELTNNLALLQRAKKSYISSLKKEILGDKAGFLFLDD